MPEHRQARDREGQHDVQPDGQQRGRRRELESAQDHDERAHQAEHRPGGAGDGPVGVAEQHDRRGSAQQRDPVEQRVPQPAEHELEVPAEHPEREHVDRDVQRTDVQEARGHQPPPLAGGDVGGHQPGRLDPRRRVVRPRATRREGRQHEDDDVDGDEGDRHDRRRTRTGAPATDGARGPRRAGGLRDTVDAVRADRRRAQAVRARRPPAPGAGQGGGPVGVPHAVRRRVRSRRGPGSRGSRGSRRGHGVLTPELLRRSRPR